MEHQFNKNLNKLVTFKDIKETFVLVFFFILLLDLTCIIITNKTFFALLYGPLIYLAAKTFSEEADFKIKYAALHFIPFIIFFSYRLNFPVEKVTHSIILTISFLFYALKTAKLDNSAFPWIIKWKKLNLFFLIASIFILIPFYLNSDLKWVKSYYITWPFFILLFLVIAKTMILVSKIKLIEKNAEKVELPKKLLIVKEISERELFIKNEIEVYFNMNRNYLNPSFTLETLSSDIAIPKTEISHVLNAVMKIKFFDYLASKRIEVAQEMLVETNKLYKIETIVEACGFNSRSSFNKYFKFFVGKTPSEFRDISSYQLR